MGFRIQRSTLSVVMLRLLCISTPPSSLTSAAFFGVGVAIRAAVCVAFSLSSRKDSARLPTRKAVYMFCALLYTVLQRPLPETLTHPWPQSRIEGHFCRSRGVRRRQCRRTVRYSKWCCIWAPAAVCMASGRFAWIRASLLLVVASSAPSHIADDQIADGQ